MILADGARWDLFRELISQGRLPHIAEALPHLYKGVTAFPSTTGPAYMPYLTGCYPGTCNVPGIRWFDRKEYAKPLFFRKPLRKFRSYVGAETFFITHDMRADIPTLFDLIPNSRNIFNSVSRGARSNPTWFSRIWHWYYAHLTDHWRLVDKAAGEKTLAALKDRPEFLFVVFPGIDEHSHLSSPFHPETVQSYIDLDLAIGQITRQLKKTGGWEETVIFIVSDHGLSKTDNHLELHSLLEKAGIDTLFYPKVVFRSGFKAACMISGNGMAHLYFKNEGARPVGGWREKTAWEELSQRKDRIIARLLERKEIDLIAGQKADGSIVVRSRRGEARISLASNISYTIRGSDPFGYPPLPSQISDRESLELTFKTDYPDALAQLLQIFRSPRSGDLILSAAKGHDLRWHYEIPEHKSSHGSLHWEHMQVPIVTNVPLPDRPIRSVDIFPTVLSLLGQKIPGTIDGVSLA